MSSAPPGPPVLDRRRLSDIVDNQLVPEILRDFLREAPGLLLRVETTASGGDGPELSAAAHELKGWALQIAGQPLADACQALVTTYHPATTPLADRLAALRVEQARLCAAVVAFLAESA